MAKLHKNFSGAPLNLHKFRLRYGQKGQDIGCPLKSKLKFWANISQNLLWEVPLWENPRTVHLSSVIVL